MNKPTSDEMTAEQAGRERGGRAEVMDFRLLAEAIPHLVWSARADGVSDYYNSRFLNYLGKTLDEMHGWTWAETLHPDDRQRCIDNWIAAFTSGTDYYEEYRIRRDSDGRYLWHEGRATPWRDEEGNIIRWFGTCTEIEEHKQRVELLRSSENKYRSLVENTSDCIWEIDQLGCFNYLSSQFLEITGYSSEEFIGKSPLTLLPKDYAEQASNNKLAEISPKTAYRQEHPVRHKNGRQVIVEVKAVPILSPEGVFQGLHGITRDITERKKYEMKQTFMVEAISQLLASEDPQQVIESLCHKVMTFLDCQVFFNFLVDEAQGKLCLNACDGISREEERQIHWLDYGMAVCGCAARDARRIVAEEIQSTPDPRTELVKSYGIRAYACHPMVVHGQVLGTLSFGTRTRDHFSEDDLTMMKTVADHVAIVLERKRIERQLRDSERRYRELVENTNSAIVRWNADGKLTFINEFAQKFFGYTSEEALGRNVNFLLPEKESNGSDLSALVQDILSYPERYVSNINENICRDGRRAWMVWTNKPIFGPDGRLSEILAIGSDITARKEVESALLESEERLRLALESAYVISFVWDIPGNEVHRTVSHEPALPATSDEYLGTFEEVVALVHPDDREQFKANVATALASENGEYESEYRLVRPDGEVVWYYERGRVKRNAAGQPVRLIGLSQDVSKRRRAEEALRESEELYRAIGESIDYGVWVCDPTGRNTYASPSFLKLVGLTQKQCSAFGWSNVLHPDDAEATIAAWKECARTGSLWSIEHRYRGVDGEWHPILARGVPVRDNHGKIKFWAGINLDISDLKRTEKSLMEAKLAAEKASRSKSEFLANMSHDIRTPMTVFLMAIEQLQQINTDPASCKLLELADKSAKALRALVDDILDISRIEACRVRLHEEPFDLRICVREVAEMFNLPAQEKSLRLTETVAPEVPAVIVADQDRLKQVLINLLGNALKFTNQGGVEVSVRSTGAALMFAVADTGIGIPEDSHHLLFQSFSQVDNTFQRQHGGSGLGLAICKGLVELMGGTISMRNREGGGSIFAFTIPLKTLAGKRSPDDTLVDERVSAPIRPVRILLADDEPMIRDIVSLALTHHGWQVETAANGSEALALWQSEPFDLILMDLQLPGMNGLEAASAIRTAESTTGRRIVIIGFTAHASEDIIENCIKAGMDYVLSKPLHFDDLSEVINRYLADNSI